MTKPGNPVPFRSNCYRKEEAATLPILKIC